MLGSLKAHQESPEPLARSLTGEGASALLARLEGPPGLAAFGAAGTIWDGDLGAELFKDLIAEGALYGAPPDPWGEYLRRLKLDPASAFTFSGEVLRGLTEVELR